MLRIALEEQPLDGLTTLARNPKLLSLLANRPLPVVPSRVPQATHFAYAWSGKMNEQLLYDAPLERRRHYRDAHAPTPLEVAPTSQLRASVTIGDDHQSVAMGRVSDEPL